MKGHPNDLLLQRFLNNRCSPTEAAKVRGHLLGCGDCRRELGRYAELDRALNGPRLTAAPADAARRIMEMLHSEEEAPIRTARPRRLPFGGELVNGFVAAVATYWFVASGVWFKIAAFGAERLGEDLQEKVTEAAQFVEMCVRLFKA